MQGRGENTVIWVVENGSVVEKGDALVSSTHFRSRTPSMNDQNTPCGHCPVPRGWRNAKRAALAVKEYEDGRFVIQYKTLEKDLAIAESNCAWHAVSLFMQSRCGNVATHRKLNLPKRNSQPLKPSWRSRRQKPQSAPSKNTKPQQLEQLRALKAAEANRDLLSNARRWMERGDLALSERIVHDPGAQE